MAKKKAKKPVRAKKIVKKKSAPKKSVPKKKVAAKRSASAKKGNPSKGALPKPVFGARSKKEVLLGEVEDYFAHIGVISITSKDALAVGDTFHVKGHTTDLTQVCASMQIDHQDVLSVKKGDEVGVKVEDRCRKGDKVFRVL